MPTRDDRVIVHFRMSRRLREDVKRAAFEDDRSMSDYILVAVKEKMARDQQRASSVPWLPAGVRRMQG